MQENIIIMDKPKGITSFDVIRMLRKKLGVRKMGHAGALDPNATGLLIIGIGEGTKRLKEYVGLSKTYIMVVELGIKTDTGDIQGAVLEESVCATPSVTQIADVLRGMVGAVTLQVPAYSALKYKGKPRYVYARKGIAIEPRMRSMEIYALKLIGIGQEGGRPLLKVKMDCASGTYARSVAEEIGKRLGAPATLRDLRRTRIGPFTIDQARALRQNPSQN